MTDKAGTAKRAKDTLNNSSRESTAHQANSIRSIAHSVIGLVEAVGTIANAMSALATENRTENMLKAEALAINPLRTEPPLTPTEKKIIERLNL